METNKIIQISMALGLVIMLGMIIILIINQMEQRFMNDCEKQDFQGIKKYWDLDINCSQIENIKNITLINETSLDR